MNYMHGEINFTPGLDEIFTIQANKSRYDISGNLLDDLRGIVEPILAKVGKDHNEDVQIYSCMVLLWGMMGEWSGVDVFYIPPPFFYHIIYFPFLHF